MYSLFVRYPNFAETIPSKTLTVSIYSIYFIKFLIHTKKTYTYIFIGDKKMKKFFKKIIFILFVIYFFILHNINFADDMIEDVIDTEIMETTTEITNEPIISSKNVVVIDRKTKTILYEKEAYKPVPMASTTKIMTCIIALENSNLNDIVTVSKKAASIHGSTLGITKNAKISMHDLLYGLMLRSGNDCAIAIAEHICGSVEEFANLMNKKAMELGLTNTHFITPHGLDDDSHYTTAYELALLTDYALKNEVFKKIVSCKTTTITINNYSKTISNTNELLGNLEGVYGVKTGFTFNAGRCLVSSCKRENLDIIVVVLGANTKNIRTKDSRNLIEYIFKNYKYVDITSTINSAFENYILYFNKVCLLEKTSTTPVLKLETLENYEYPLSLNNSIKLNTKIYTFNKFNPDTKPTSKVGILQLYNGNNILCDIDIYLENQLIKNNWKYYFKNILLKFKSLYV